MTTNPETLPLTTLKKTNCPKLCASDKSHLTYEIAQHTDTKEFLVRVCGNSVGGFFSKQ